MKEQVVIKKYASALVESFTEENYKELLGDIDLLETVFSGEEKLLMLLQSHLVDKKEKEQILNEIVKELKFSTIWKSLFLLLIKNNRFNLFPQILSSAKDVIFKKQGKLKLKLKLARKQDNETLDKILQFLKTKLHKEIIAEIEYDKSIIGGFRAETDDMIIDGSIQNNLKKFIQANRTKSS